MKRDNGTVAAFTIIAWLNFGALLAMLGGRYSSDLFFFCAVNLAVGMWGAVRAYSAPTRDREK